MRPLTESEIRSSFVNCSKGEARRLFVPRDLPGLPWADLDFLGWRDPGAPDRAYLVAERGGELTGVVLRAVHEVRRSAAKSTMCSVCLTPHAGSGSTLFTAARVGAAGRQGNTVGVHMCADLACPLYLRGLRKSETGLRFTESLSLEERVARAGANLDAFLAKILHGEAAAS
ncbi:FBP domain-containing protein [Bailinhaonella thermotolerans]|uniref:FBP domain-containing protein n=2 Tax=Bailinhaonella thermotolerans TaxID=1070861 RepID=A0A3A4AWG3_9ACTN|nr:FBP domain-containing protein [Bailinhaonella thermotolerans]RJL34600.1 FBP domain-containing protein [Bailinhaonella thermotolerans]